MLVFTSLNSHHHPAEYLTPLRSKLTTSSLKSINKSNICTNNSFIYINISFILTNISFIYTFLRGFSKSLVRWCRFSSGVELIFKPFWQKRLKTIIILYHRSRKSSQIKFWQIPLCRRGVPCGRPMRRTAARAVPTRRIIILVESFGAYFLGSGTHDAPYAAS